MARFARVSLLLVGVGLLLGTVAYAGVPDPSNSIIQVKFSDSFIVASPTNIVVTPNNQATGNRAEIYVQCYDAANNLVPNAVVFVVFSKAANDTMCWCNTQLQSNSVITGGRREFHATADANGIAKFQISAGACLTSTGCVQIKGGAAGSGTDPDAAQLLHSYDQISSPDNAGAASAVCDGAVDVTDFVNYGRTQSGVYPFSPCYDYDGTGTVDASDFVVFGRQDTRGLAACAHTGPKM